jgi:crotonobetainyl-CoA:carnitine CoA-transferase CaiB-like acyl-CoA transferase
MLDYQVNGRGWERIGNTSPYKPALVHGVFRCRGDDRWIAIAVFTEAEWDALAAVLGRPAWMAAPGVVTAGGAPAAAHRVEELLGTETGTWDAFELMERLQTAGVPAGVCQTAQDRIERDPQLAHDEWLTPVHSAEVGTWPVRQFPIGLSETPFRPGGRPDRGFPCYAEDNDYVFGTLLGLSEAEQRDLAANGVM